MAKEVPSITEPRVSERFNAQDANIVFQSADGVMFYIHKQNLAACAERFSPPERSIFDVVTLSESSSTLELLFQFIYHQPQPDLKGMESGVLFMLAEAAEKYRVYSAMNLCSIHLIKRLPDHSEGILMHALKHNNQKIVARAAPLLLDRSLEDVLHNMPQPYHKAWARIRYHTQWSRAWRFSISCVPNAQKLPKLRCTSEECGKLGHEYVIETITRLSAGMNVLHALDSVFPSAKCSSCEEKMSFMKSWRKSLEAEIKRMPSISVVFFPDDDPSEETKAEPDSLVEVAHADGETPVQRISFGSDADIIFQSVDGVFFELHQQNIKACAANLLPPEYDSIAPIQLPHASSTLRLLFQFLYPFPHPDLELIDFHTLELLFTAAEQYKIYTALGVIEIRLSDALPLNLVHHTSAVMKHALRTNNRKLMDMGAPLLIGKPLLDTVKLMSSDVIIQWLGYHERWNEIAREAFKFCSDQSIKERSEHKPSKRNRRCDGSSDHLTVKVLSKLGRGAPSLQNLDDTFDVLISLQKLSTDFAKAAEALRIWGSGEGDDLGDILSASTTLLTLWASVLSQYASHGHPMRDYLKLIRTREENLDDLKRRRKAVCSKAESAERKLSRMSPEHKNLTMQTDSLNALRAEIRSMDSEIMTEEAALGDYKRSNTRAWMGLKFGGLLECAEKGAIAGEYGKLIIAEIPEEHTQPGMARNLYYGRAKTEQLLSEAHRCISEVVMSTVPSSRMSTSSQPGFQNAPPNPFGTPHSAFQSLGMQNTGGQPPQNEWSPHNSSDMTPAGGAPSNYLPAPQGLGTGEFFNQPGSPTAGPGSPTQPGAPYYSQLQNEPRSVDDFGVHPPGPIDQPGPGSGGRFATFPVKNRPSGLAGYTLSDPPVRQESESFSSSVAQALSSSQSPPATVPQAQQGFGEFGRPDVSYEVSHAATYAPPQGPPPGAATQPRPGTAWNTSLHHEERHAPSDEEGGLAYMTNPDDDAASRHVRFGEVNDVDDELDRRGRLGGNVSQYQYSQEQPASPHQQQYMHQEQPASPHQQQYLHQEQPASPHQQQYLHQKQQQQQQFPPEGQPPQYQPLPPAIDTAQLNLEHSQASQAGGLSGDSSPTTDTRFQNQRRVPPPSVDPSETDERALNAAAAREVSRELDALNLNSNTSPPVSPNTQTFADPHDREPLSLDHGHGAATAPQIDNGPLVPPSAPFSRRTPSPHPGTADSPTLPYSPYGTPPATFSQHNPPPSQYPQEPAQYPPPTHYAQESVQYQQPPPQPAHDGQMSKGSTPRHSGSAAAPPRISQDDFPPRLPPLSTRLSSSTSTSPYQTPPEYPNRGGALGGASTGSPITKSSTTSLNSQVQVAPGTRTISAAAFKRPQRMASGELPPSLADGRSTSPLSVKKRLPSSPYPQQQREGSPGRHRRGRSGSPAQPPAAPAPSQALPPVPTGQEEEYDYLSAYVDSGAPLDAGAPNAANERGRAQGHGYGEGRFATDLDGSLR
ncbi:hypothetical protein D9615_010459 [Tricholomella constricta]|uniref:BTB domain-containing protein n=1 Tax=Tricholomella constricta TaxID=117010 RepID=A0A8H5GM36_9AGAR|nr:hypothetical protein D9615_010459 [Tricholomella constricta]